MDWSLTTSDLSREMQEGKRASVSGTEISWAREYERSSIPSEYRYPMQGYVYESQVDQRVSYDIIHKGNSEPRQGSAMLFKGERIWIEHLIIEKKALSVYAIPMEYQKLEAKMVRSWDRDKPNYKGFLLELKTTTLNERFALIKTGYKK